MSKLKSINPSNYQEIGSVEISTPEDIKQKVNLAHQAKQSWRELGVNKRVELLKEVFAEFKARKEEIALLESQEMGMPLSDALIDVDGTLDYATWYFDNAQKYLSPETTFENETEIHQVVFEPIGVTALIIPWNFPFANFVWGGLQGLICGNVVVMKHSEEVPLCAKLIEQIMSGHHLPAGVFSVIYGAGDVGEFLVNENIDLITFTGSTKVGKQLYELAGKKFIKAVVELGGSAPGIVFADANLDVAVENICFNRLLNQGQCCDGLKRIIVHESIADELTNRLKVQFEAKEIGPLVAKRQLDLLVSQVEDAKNKGAVVVTGGNSLEKEKGGAFFPPTILKNVTPDMRVWHEEVFGPVLPVMTFKTEEEAIKLANDTAYGLGSYLYAQDEDVINRVSNALEAGMVSVNGTNYIMPFNPFGGYKNSGFGREHGRYGFHELTQIKIIARNK
ncbi:MAG: aldehyde dehydrogenase family protein [Candidatus Shapirobacteria bacterium]|jgi:acyl-CoA reductase-like NAD-dependent aldehyde dehydrogenase